MSGGVFLWGKLPAHGDFVMRGLDPTTRDEFDHWMSAEIQAARDALANEFEARYDEAPPWYFVTDGAAAGAMAPSMDAVGRRYPILVGRFGVTGGDEQVFAQECEEAIYRALEGGWTADRLVEEVAVMPSPPPGERITSAERWWTLGGEHYPADEILGARPDGLVRRILARTAGASA